MTAPTCAPAAARRSTSEPPDSADAALLGGRGAALQARGAPGAINHSNPRYHLQNPNDRSATKFNSGCGWPAYYANKEGAVDRHEDRAFGMTRVEITCANCG